MTNASESLEKMRQAIKADSDGVVAGDIRVGCTDDLADFLSRLLSDGYADVVADGAEDEWWDTLAKAALR